MNNGYIRLHRKITEWEWYSNINDRLVFIQCLLDANWKDGYFNGIAISRGSFPTSIEKLSGEIGLTFSQIRTSLKHLKLTNNITIKSFRHFSIITINNYEKYQDDDKQDDNLIASSSQANDKLIAIIEKSKKEKKKKNNNIYDEEFNELWKIYPNKQGKTDAKKKYVKYRSEGVTYEEILKGLENYVEYVKRKNIEQQYIKYGSTWFNQKCWEDEYESETSNEKNYVVTDGGVQFL